MLSFEGDVEAVYDSTFQITYESFGEMKTYELKPGGSTIPLTKENREEYVDLYVKYLLEDSVDKQINAFLKGFRLLCDTPGFRVNFLSIQTKSKRSNFKKSFFEAKNSNYSFVEALN